MVVLEYSASVAANLEEDFLLLLDIVTLNFTHRTKISNLI